MLIESYMRFHIFIVLVKFGICFLSIVPNCQHIGLMEWEYFFLIAPFPDHCLRVPFSERIRSVFDRDKNRFSSVVALSKSHFPSSICIIFF